MGLPGMERIEMPVWAAVKKTPALTPPQNGEGDRGRGKAPGGAQP
jgi:hypothetical protein